MHAPIAMAAMELGKHVRAKPLTWCGRGANRTALANGEKVATQMGNQGHSLMMRAKRWVRVGRGDRRSS
jgi:hypothetical protein